jgi:hypothetical protein
MHWIDSQSTNSSSDEQMDEIELQTAFENLLAAVGAGSAAIPEESVSLFSGQRGQKYSGELMVVGRAVNGWNGSYDPASWILGNARKDDVKKAFTGDVEAPLDWVGGLWNAQPKKSDGSRIYSTGRSAFWRVIRQILGHLDASEQTNDWATHLVWTNLYKVAPPEKGNPSGKLCRFQQSGAENVLSCELKIYNPKRVLFLTGSNWFLPFSIPIGFTSTVHPAGKLVERIGHIRTVNGRIDAVVAKHPQGKPEDRFVTEVCEAFSGLADRAQSLVVSA